MKTFLSLACLPLLAVAPQVNAEVVVGVVDAGYLSPEETADYSIETVEAVPREVEATFDHGRLITDVVVAEWKKVSDDKLKILFVSAFEHDPEPLSQRGAILNYQVMYHGMVKMRDAGVKYVCTAYSGSDIEGSETFARFADKLGLTIVASLGNNDSDMAYPAMTEGVVGVTATEYRFFHNRGKEWKDSVDYKVTGVVDENTRGSSFAAARACAHLAAKA